MLRAVLPNSAERFSERLIMPTRKRRLRATGASDGVQKRNLQRDPEVIHSNTNTFFTYENLKPVDIEKDLVTALSR